ncbi:MAG: hypothetical protein ACE5GB_08190 [Acidimicrobiales bacterium]
MIDYGLLVSLIIAFGGPALLGNWWLVTGRDEPVGFLDVAVGPAFAGLAVGRLTTLALDDPSSIGSLSDMLIIRSGVEFWPGVAAALAVAVVSANLGLVSTSRRICDLAPLAMVGYAGYEVACIFRDGCFGPDSAVGLSPPGLTTTMLPIGWFMAAAVTLAAVGVRALATRGHLPIVVVLAGLLAVASARAVGSIWLPHVGDGPTRQHLTSIGVVAISAMAVVIAVVRPPRREPCGTPTQA